MDCIACRWKIDQMVEALTCPVNRHCTRVKHNCDDWELFHRPGLLVMHFIENGGALEFRNRRKAVEEAGEMDMYLGA